MPWVRKSIRPSLTASSSKTRMNSSPMIFRFCSGSSTPASRAQEPLAGVDHDQVHPEVALERDAQELGLLLAHQAVVDVDAGQPVADGAMDERGGHRRVDAARQGADDEAVRAGRGGMRVHPGADLGDGRLDEVGRRPGRRGAGDARARSCAGRPGRAACGRPRGGTGSRTGCRSGAARPANGDESVWAVERKPSGRRVIESPWLIQTGWSRSRPGEQAVVRR